jgi:hypothetical protein
MALTFLLVVLLHRLGAAHQVLNRFPGVFRGIISFLFHQVVWSATDSLVAQDLLDFVFLLFIF